MTVVSKLVLVVKHLACLADLVIVPVAAGTFGFTGSEWAGILEVEPMARILVIDDEPDIRTFLEEILKSAGHEVILAADGREGVERHRTSPADLVITDLYMPIQDGMKTIREFRNGFPEVAIIAMSGGTNSGTILPIAQNLADVGILHKPFAVGELIAAVTKALGGQAPPPACQPVS